MEIPGCTCFFEKKRYYFTTMKNLNPKYHFLRPNPDSMPEARYLICPNCREMLAPADIEAFATCPFCNTHLEYSNELEDFILAPLVAQWMNSASALAARARRNLK